ncbi:unnamed protein product [Bursaphelenchus xylophilus]|uniref:(pine wood nematode) hypothetical protein n=1 Tax=Bursaphelenchus xylophilus TaxID=6326 RepID=A0A1I7S0T9_BURXY|nr:unnamed protein product [Bursaphelenchus xylophilus]CAG9088433.1 unnamed protein product [Bursaphelenchus xylophilus]
MVNMGIRELLAACLVMTVDSVFYKGFEISPPNPGVIDRNFRFENFPTFIQKEANFNAFCKHLPTLLTAMSRADADVWVKNFCLRTGEQAACNSYYSANAREQLRVNAQIEYYENQFNYTAEYRKYVDKVLAVRKDLCLSVEEECFITNGMKWLLSYQQRDAMHLVTENCRQSNPVSPDFKAKSCYPPVKGPPQPTYESLHS